MSVSADLICGDTGDGKTTTLGSVILWMHERHKLKSRLYTATNYEHLRPFIELGLLQVWDMRLTPTKFAIDVIRKACKGCWYDAKTQKILRPEQAGLPEIGAHLFEGLSWFAGWQLNYFADRVANDGVGEGGSVGKAADAPFWIKEGDASGGTENYRVGGNSQTHYNAVQKEIEQRIEDSQRIPHARKIVWTALLRKGVDKEDTGLPLLGPDLAGSAKIHKIPSWFGNYVTVERKGEGAAVRFVLHTAQWKEMPMGMMHKNKLRTVFIAGVTLKPTNVPAEMEPDMGKLYDLVDESLEAGTAALRARLEKNAAGSKS